MKAAATLMVVSALFAGTALANASDVSKKTPGHMMQTKGSVKGSPGASGYAPGHLMQTKGSVKRQTKGSVKRETGASGYAPGKTSGSGSTR